MTAKFQLRKHFKALRSKIKAGYREEASKKAAMIFASQTLFVNSEHIACYLAFKDEFDAAPIIEAIWLAKKKCYLPVLAEDGKSLFFVRYKYGDALHLNRYSILEPVHTTHKLAAELLDITITPLIAFDKEGHRLGTGGGYYDRTFAFLKEPLNEKPHMIGLGYQEQEADKLPSDPWDISLEAVITEQHFIVCK